MHSYRVGDKVRVAKSPYESVPVGSEFNIFRLNGLLVFDAQGMGYYQNEVEFIQPAERTASTMDDDAGISRFVVQSEMSPAWKAYSSIIDALAAAVELALENAEYSKAIKYTDLMHDLEAKR